MNFQTSSAQFTDPREQLYCGQSQDTGKTQIEYARYHRHSLDLSRFRAVPSARSNHLPFESRGFLSQMPNAVVQDCRTRLQNPLMYSRIATSAYRCISHDHRQIKSALMVLKNTSTAALLAFSFAAHRHAKPVLTQDLLILVRRVLRPMIPVVNAAFGRRTECDSHLHHPDRQVPFHPIADHGPTVHVSFMRLIQPITRHDCTAQDHRQMQSIFLHPDIADTDLPFLI